MIIPSESLISNILFEYKNEIPLNTLKTWRDSILESAKFQQVGWTGNNKEPYRHWAAYPNMSDTIYKEIFDCMNISAKEDGFNLHPCRAIVNMYNHGDSSWLHSDSSTEDAWTLLLFMNEYWDINWGGDFILSENNEILKAVAPTPGKFILFKANILHAGRPVSREAQFSRMALAIQCINKI